MKYFVISDVHSYYTLMKKALADKGFDEKNPEHKVILCGDAFDRGTESNRMFNWLKKMIKLNKLIYVRGNHEDLLLDLLVSGKPGTHDVTNGTYSTIMQLGGSKYLRNRDKMLEGKTYYYELIEELQYYSADFRDALEATKLKGIAEFIEDNCVDYFETEHYIFVHGWVCHEHDLSKCTKAEWEHVRWTNGMEKFLRTSFTFGKKIVVGHWHCNWLRDKSLPEEEQWKDFSIEHQVKGNGDECYAIDACTAFSKQVNVLVIED